LIFGFFSVYLSKAARVALCLASPPHHENRRVTCFDGGSAGADEAGATDDDWEEVDMDAFCCEQAVIANTNRIAKARLVTLFILLSSTLYFFDP
jgi:hypothetical protein